MKRIKKANTKYNDCELPRHGPKRIIASQLQLFCEWWSINSSHKSCAVSFKLELNIIYQSRIRFFFKSLLVKKSIAFNWGLSGNNDTTTNYQKTHFSLDINHHVAKNSPGRGKRNSHQVGIGRGISGRQKSMKKGSTENSPGGLGSGEFNWPRDKWWPLNYRTYQLQLVNFVKIVRRQRHWNMSMALTIKSLLVTYLDWIFILY